MGLSLGSAAGKAALTEAGLAADEIDGLVISTCTGYLCPGLTSYVVERLGLRADVLTFDLVGQGQIRISVNQTYALADAATAHRDLEARKTTGSTILLP